MVGWGVAQGTGLLPTVGGLAARAELKECWIRVSFPVMRTKTAVISIEQLKPDDLPILRRALEAVPGVEAVDFNVERSVAALDFDPAQSHIDDFLRAVLKAGFKVL